MWVGRVRRAGTPPCIQRRAAGGAANKDRQPLVLAVGAGSWCWQYRQLVLAVLAVRAVGAGSAGSAGRFPGGGLGWISGNTVCRMGC